MTGKIDKICCAIQSRKNDLLPTASDLTAQIENVNFISKVDVHAFCKEAA
jgi:hypothetical protein